MLSDPGRFREIDALVIGLTNGCEGVEVLNVAVQKEGEATLDMESISLSSDTSIKEKKESSSATSSTVKSAVTKPSSTGTLKCTTCVTADEDNASFNDRNLHREHFKVILLLLLLSLIQ